MPAIVIIKITQLPTWTHNEVLLNKICCPTDIVFHKWSINSVTLVPSFRTVRLPNVQCPVYHRLCTFLVACNDYHQNDQLYIWRRKDVKIIIECWFDKMLSHVILSLIPILAYCCLFWSGGPLKTSITYLYFVLDF